MIFGDTVQGVGEGRGISLMRQEVWYIHMYICKYYN